MGPRHASRDRSEPERTCRACNTSMGPAPLILVSVRGKVNFIACVAGTQSDDQKPDPHINTLGPSLHPEYNWRVKRKRLQIDLGATEQLALERIRGLGENDAEAGRQAVTLIARLATAIGEGFTIAAVPPDEGRFADALPELTSAVAPERRYRYLVRVRHPWRRQLSLKGRRLTVGQLVAQMESNQMDVPTAAEEFDLPREAVAEALDYAARNRELLIVEASEERRRVESIVAYPGR